MNAVRSRWAAIGAAVAVTLGAGGVGLVAATSPAEAVAYVPITPCRMVDTRAGEFNIGTRTTPLGANDTHTVSAFGNSGLCVGIPTASTGLQLNVTAVNATAPTFLTIWASGARPRASSLNPSPQQPPAPNAVATGLSASGQFQVFNRAGSVELIIDVVGYYSDHHHDDRYYTLTEVNALVGAKADTADVYTRSQADGQFLPVDQGSTAVGSTDDNEAVEEPDEIITSVIAETPTTGVLVATATTSIFGFESPAEVRCSLVTGMSLDNNFFTSDVGANQWATMAGTRAFDLDAVPAGGTTTVNLVCDGTGPNLIGDTNLTVIFTPDHP